MTIQEWAVEGLNLAQEKRKSVDDLILFLRMASMTANAFGLTENMVPQNGDNHIADADKKEKTDGQIDK